MIELKPNMKKITIINYKNQIEENKK